MEQILLFDSQPIVEAKSIQSILMVQTPAQGSVKN